MLFLRAYILVFKSGIQSSRLCFIILPAYPILFNVICKANLYALVLFYIIKTIRSYNKILRNIAHNLLLYAILRE